MRLHLFKFLAIGAMVVTPLGCETQPDVDGDADTTVVEEENTVLEDDADPNAGVDTPALPETDAPTTEPGTGVDINVDEEPTEPNL